jgi:hypothetical protein
VLFIRTRFSKLYTAVDTPAEAACHLSDPNMDPEYLGHLVMVGVNKKSYKPSTANVKDKYYELFSGQGGKGLERNEGMEEG